MGKTFWLLITFILTLSIVSANLLPQKRGISISVGEQTLYEITASELTESQKQWMRNEWQLPNVSLAVGTRFTVKFTSEEYEEGIPIGTTWGVFEFREGSSPEMTFSDGDSRMPSFFERAFLAPTKHANIFGYIGYSDSSLYWRNATYDDIIIRVGRNITTGWIAYYLNSSPNWKWEVIAISTSLESSNTSTKDDFDQLILLSIIIPIALIAGIATATIIRRVKR